MGWRHARESFSSRWAGGHGRLRGGPDRGARVRRAARDRWGLLPADGRRKNASVGVNLRARPNPSGPEGSSPVLWALRVDDLELLTLLLDHPGNPNQVVECQSYC